MTQTPFPPIIPFTKRENARTENITQQAEKQLWADIRSCEEKLAKLGEGHDAQKERLMDEWYKGHAQLIINSEHWKPKQTEHPGYVSFVIESDALHAPNGKSDPASDKLHTQKLIQTITDMARKVSAVHQVYHQELFKSGVNEKGMIKPMQHLFRIDCHDTVLGAMQDRIRENAQMQGVAG